MEVHNSSLFGVNLIAYIRAEMGLGTAARGLAHALTSAKVPFNVLNFEQGNPSLHRDTSWTHKEATVSSYPFTILAINPDNLSKAKTQVQEKFVKDRYTVGYWFWELPEIPDDWQSSFPLVDEVWAASRFVQDAISQKSPVPVFRVPVPILLNQPGEFSRHHFSLPERQFLFLSMSDTQSQLTRKNPLGTIKAFKEAFRKNDRHAGLVLRINNANTVHGDGELIGEIRNEIRGYRNIYLLDAAMTGAEISALLSACDCFVSLHRSEGFGLGPAEAMSLGKPVILTKWSGNTDYMTSTNSIGIRYKLVPVGRQYGPYEADQRWADPDLKQAAFWMTRLMNDPELANRIGQQGRKTIQSSFSPEAIGQIIRKRLDYLFQGDPTPFQVFSPRAGSHDESHSYAREFQRRRWQRITLPLRRGLGDGTAPLRVDPGNKAGIIDLAAVSLRSGLTGKIIWRRKTRDELADLTVGGTAIQLPHDRLLRLLSLGEDPQILLPLLAGPQFEGPLILEAWVRLDDSPALITQALTQCHLSYAATAARERDLSAKDKAIAELTDQLESLRRRHHDTQQELVARETECFGLQELVAAKDQARLRLLEELAQREKDRGALLRHRQEERAALALLQSDLATKESEIAELLGVFARKKEEQLGLRLEKKQIATLLESTRRDVWKHKVRRADATARFNKSEQSLRAIQGSLMWKLIKPIRKLQAGSSRAGEDEKSPGHIAFAIDSPATWHTTAEKLLIKGWCFFPSGEEIAGVRAKIGRKSYIGSYGLERNDVVATIGHRSISLNSGFTIECPLPNGSSRIALEAIVQGGEWRPFFEQEILRQAADEYSPTPFGAKADRSGGGRDEVTTETGVALDLLKIRFERHAHGTGDAVPRFSVITATFNTKPHWLIDAAQSLLSQTYPLWEWCVVDDGSTDPQTRSLLEGLARLSPRLRIRLAERGGISSATNQALALASGQYVCFMDHDDLLAPDALETVSAKIDQGFDVVYSDEDKLDETTGELKEPFFKPDWSPEYLRGVMYVGHLLTVRRSLAEMIGFDSNFDGVQDYEFMLRLSERNPRIGHVPKILYHWRKVAGSVAASSDAKPGLDLLQKQAVDSHLRRLGLPVETQIQGGHRLRMIPLRKSDPPRISIIIPTKDAPALIGRCLGSLFEQTNYPRFQVIVVDNGTTDASALDTLRNYPIERVDFAGPFNFSRANNLGSKHALNGYLVFLNNDTEILTPDWLQHLLYYAEQPDVGAAGPLLVYDNRTVQHAGVALGMRGTADHVMRGFPQGVDGYAGSLACARDVSAVTAACMMMSKDRFDEIGGFNEYFATAYQDVDLCLRLRARGLRIIYTPQAVLVHHESVSRKSYYDMVDRMFLLDQWDAVIEKGDPYYNRNLDLERGDYSRVPR